MASDAEGVRAALMRRQEHIERASRALDLIGVMRDVFCGGTG